MVYCVDMKMDKNKNLIFSIVVEKDSDGYFAECRELQGCYAQGTTYEEAVKNIKEVIELHIEDRVERGDLRITPPEQISLTTFSLAVPCHVA